MVSVIVIGKLHIGVMGIDLTTWRARIGLYYYRLFRPLQTRCRSDAQWLYRSGVSRCGIKEVMNDIPLVFKGCLTVISLSLILQYVVRTWPMLRSWGGSSKVHSRCRQATPRLNRTVISLLLKAFVVVGLLLVIAGDVEQNPGPPKMKGTTLTMKSAMNALTSASPKWHMIGVQLEIPSHKLRNIRLEFSNPMDQLREMLDVWMNEETDPNLSWGVIIDALKSPSVDESRLARKIEEKYCVAMDPDEVSHCEGEEGSELQQDRSNTTPTKFTEERKSSHTASEGLVTRSPGLNSNIATVSPSKGSENPPFGCGCSKCTFFSYIDSGCPTPISSVSSFPYLSVDKLTLDQQDELRGRLRLEFDDILVQFQNLVSATMQSLTRREVEIDEIVSHIMTLGAFDPVFKEPEMPAFQHCIKELKTAKTVAKVFLTLEGYFSFFNYHIIEQIIKFLGSPEDKKGLENYVKYFEEYAKRRLYECHPQFGPLSETDHADIFVKVDSKYENYTVTEVEKFRCRLCKILRVSSNGVLRFCRVEKGCFQLWFQIPLLVQQRLFQDPLSKEQESALLAEKVIMFKCGEYQFEDPDASHMDTVEEVTSIQTSHYDDDDSAVDLNLSGDVKSSSLSEGVLERELEEMEYESRVTASKSQAGSSALKLHYAAEQGDLETVRMLVEKQQCSTMVRDQWGNTALHAAARRGQLEVLDYFISDKSCSASCPGHLRMTPLHVACDQGCLDVVKYLVTEQRVKPQCKDSYGNTPLHRACVGGYRDVVEFLTEELAKSSAVADFIPQLINNWSNTPLHTAAINGHLGILQFFVTDQKCDPNIPGQYSRTPFHCASEFGHLPILKYLTDEGCNPSCLDEYRYTPLHCAVMRGHMDVVKFLTQEKLCDPMCRDYKQETPLHYAASNGHMDIVKFLTSLDYEATCKNVTNRTPLHLASQNGHLEIVRFLISELNCNQNIPGWNGRTPLHVAAEFGHLHIVQYLTDEVGCDPLSQDDENATPLLCASTMGHIGIVKFLTLEKHCDPACGNVKDFTPFHSAVQKGHLEIVPFLISDPLQATVISIPELSADEARDKFRGLLTATYKEMPEIPPNQWPPVKKLFYVNLALVTSQEMTQDDTFSRGTLHGTVDDVLKQKMPINYGDVFPDETVSERSVTLIEGPPGCGKTTLITKFSHDWAKREVLKNVEILIMVQLRCFMGRVNLTIEDMVGVYCKSNEVVKYLVQTFEQTGGEKVCFALDGVDEYSSQMEPGKLVYNLINGYILPKASIIVTCRPAGAQNLRRSVQRDIEIIGFSVNEILKYINNYFQGNPTKAGSLVSFLQNHPNISRMCHSPLHLAMVTYLYEYDCELPETETDLYMTYTLQILLRTLERELDPAEIDDLEFFEFDDLPEGMKQAFNDICSLAFVYTVQSRQVFTGKEILNKKLLPVVPSKDDFRTLGLLTVNQTSEMEISRKSLSFLQLTLQEFLSASYLSRQCSDQDLKAKIAEYGSNIHMPMVWKFYCGLASSTSSFLESFNAIVQKNISSRLSVLHMMHCAFESQKPEACTHLLEYIHGKIDIKEITLNSSDCSVLGYVMMNAAQKVTELDLSYCHLGLSGIEAIAQRLQQSFPSLHLLSLQCTNLTERAGKHLRELLRTLPNLERLNLCQNALGDVGVVDMLPGLYEAKSLLHLSLTENGISDSGAIALAGYVSTTDTLVQLWLNDNVMSDKGKTALHEAEHAHLPEPELHLLTLT